MTDQVVVDKRIRAVIDGRVRVFKPGEKIDAETAKAAGVAGRTKTQKAPAASSGSTPAAPAKKTAARRRSRAKTTRSEAPVAPAKTEPKTDSSS